MRRAFLFSLLSNISIFAQNQELVKPDKLLLFWLLASFGLMGVLFWAMNKALKTREAKYRYIIVGVFLLLVLLIFI
jgi:hypothetical protein